MQPPLLLQSQVSWKEMLLEKVKLGIEQFFACIEDDQFQRGYELSPRDSTSWDIRVPMESPEVMATLTHLQDDEKFVVDGRLELLPAPTVGYAIAFPVTRDFWQMFIGFFQEYLTQEGYGDCLFEFEVREGKSSNSEGYTCLFMTYFGRRVPDAETDQ